MICSRVYLQAGPDHPFQPDQSLVKFGPAVSNCVQTNPKKLRQHQSMKFICDLLFPSRHKKRSDPPSRRPPARPSDVHCMVHPSQHGHGGHGGTPERGSPVLGHFSPRDMLRSHNHMPMDSPERRRRTGHGSLTNISRHESLKKMESPPIRRSTSSGQYTGFSDAHRHHGGKPLDPETIAQVSAGRAATRPQLPPPSKPCPAL